MRQLIVSFLLALTLTSCYRMPTDDDYCLVPNINNPDITREKGGSAMPNLKY